MRNHPPKAVQVSLPLEGGGPRSGGRSFLHPPPTNYSFKFQFIEQFLMRRSAFDLRSDLARERYSAGDLIAQFIELLEKSTI